MEQISGKTSIFLFEQVKRACQTTQMDQKLSVNLIMISQFSCHVFGVFLPMLEIQMQNLKTSQ